MSVVFFLLVFSQKNATLEFTISNTISYYSASIIFFYKFKCKFVNNAKLLTMFANGSYNVGLLAVSEVR